MKTTNNTINEKLFSFPELFSTIAYIVHSYLGRRTPLESLPPRPEQISCEVLTLYDSVLGDVERVLLECPISLTSPAADADPGGDSAASGASSKQAPGSGTSTKKFDEGGQGRSSTASSSSTAASERGSSSPRQRAGNHSAPFRDSVRVIKRRVMKRSEVTSENEVQRFFARPDCPDLLLICHKVTSQRTPLLDEKGLYTKYDRFQQRLLENLHFHVLGQVFTTVFFHDCCP